MDSLAVLLRLARQQLDEERRALLAIDQAIAATRDQLIVLRQVAEQERRAACALADADLRLATYQRRVRAQEQRLRADLRRLEKERAVQSERLAGRHLALRRLEILAGRRAEELRAGRARREQKMIDELIVARRYADGRG